MSTVSPFLSFQPLTQKRVWGGRQFEQVFGRELPDAEAHWGESWEISAREEVMSVVTEGEFAGWSLERLWQEKREEVFGGQWLEFEGVFPLLIKWLDCQAPLSVQVHPSEEQKRLEGAETKTESWFVAAAGPKAEIFFGMEAACTAEEFRAACESGEMDGVIQRVVPQVGEVYHLPSGRVHALGGDLLIAEVQQSSDTTFRLWDWGRVGMDGKPRDLHLDEGLKAASLEDVKPLPQASAEVDCESYHLKVEDYLAGGAVIAPHGECRLVGLLEGTLTAGEKRMQRGEWILLTAAGGGALVVGEEGAQVMVVEMKGERGS